MLPVQTNMICIPNPLKTSSTNGFPRRKALRRSAARSHNLLFYREACHLRKIVPRASQHPPSARRFSILRGWRGGRGGRSRGYNAKLVDTEAHLLSSGQEIPNSSGKRPTFEPRLSEFTPEKLQSQEALYPSAS